MRVLIVDDNEVWANLAASVLRPVVTRVRIAGTMEEAMRTIRLPNGFDVVLLDLELPDSQAAETVKKVQQIAETGRKVVIVTGAHITAQMEAGARAAGASGCIYKGDLDMAHLLQVATT